VSTKRRAADVSPAALKRGEHLAGGLTPAARLLVLTIPNDFPH
jgi:hypothetical protein